MAKILEPDASKTCLLEAFMKVPLLQALYILEAAVLVGEDLFSYRLLVLPLGQQGFLALVALVAHIHKRCQRTHAGKIALLSIRGPKDPRDLPVKHS
jgi:hypothetical protein